MNTAKAATKWRDKQAWIACDRERGFVSAGNGAEFQYPVFPTRKEGRAWAERHEWFHGEIVKAIVRFYYA